MPQVRKGQLVWTSGLNSVCESMLSPSLYYKAFNLRPTSFGVQPCILVEQVALMHPLCVCM